MKADDPYDALDGVIDKLSSQMSKFKSKLQKKYKGSKDFMFAELPETEEAEELHVVKRKKFELIPMTVDEAIVQMELLAHNFFVFLNMETDSVNVVYRRNDNDYGLLERHISTQVTIKSCRVGARSKAAEGQLFFIRRE